ncbi:MAG: RagB/SusD family nutrient uptake outer membrane protein [Bacteroidota bacterium]
MYAEVEFLLGNTTGPGLDALNEVRLRVDMPTIDALSVEAIKHERDIELAYEFSR